MDIYFPYPVKNAGLFSSRAQIVCEFSKMTDHTNFHFREKLPDALEIYNYFQLLSKDNYDNGYLGGLLTGQDPWKFLAAISDLDNIYNCLKRMLELKEKSGYIMTNTGGHHCDNAHYELFCPLNHLFFMVEYLNYQANFPEIMWIDIDAHFGNGDKKMFDGYKKKMVSESNNVTGISFHNDYGNIKENNFIGRQYPVTIQNEEYIKMLQEHVDIPERVRYLLVFVGTDIVKGDYGLNENITLDTLAKVIDCIESKISPDTGIIYIQTGGAASENISYLIKFLRGRQLG